MKLLIIFALIGLSTAFKWNKDAISNPLTGPLPYCNLIETGHPLCDPDRLLEPNQHAYLFEKQSVISRLGECPCAGSCNDGENGVVVGLLFITDYEGDRSNEFNPPALQELTDHNRRKWQLGTCDNSILITIATEPQKYGLSIGERATQVLNETWYRDIIEANFNRGSFHLYPKIKEILYMYENAIREEMKIREISSNYPLSSSTDPNNNTTLFSILILCILIVIIVISSILMFLVLRHRKENDDVSIRDVWTKKFWLKAGNQYKEAKQSEGEKDIEKNEEEVKAKLASTEDLKQIDDIENADVEIPGKFSKV